MSWTIAPASAPKEEGVWTLIARPEVTKSGRLNLKVPVTLHSELSALAEQERVSLNYLVGVLLAAAVRGLRTSQEHAPGVPAAGPLASGR